MEGEMRTSSPSHGIREEELVPNGRQGKGKPKVAEKEEE